MIVSIIIWLFKLTNIMLVGPYGDRYLCTLILPQGNITNDNCYTGSFHAGKWSLYFAFAHKCLLNREQQSHCTFQILDGWSLPQGNPIITWLKHWESFMTSNKINVWLRVVKVRFTQSDFRILDAPHNLSEGKKRREKVTLVPRFYTITSLIMTLV